MKLTRKFPIFYLMMFLLSCDAPLPQSSLKEKQPLIKKDRTSKRELENNLFVFVGEKISVTPIPHEPGDFDSRMKAKYLILQRVYGHCDKDTIEFTAYDHYGRFAFADYKNAMLYVYDSRGSYYHEKYLYDPVFKTKDSRWAGTYSEDYHHPYNEHTSIKPELIDFAEELSFPTKIFRENQEITLTYSAPYYKTAGDKAIPVYGNYVPELFTLKKDGVLTARELF